MTDLPPDVVAEAPAPRRRARIYLGVLLGGVVVIALGLALFGWRLGPPEGDLARTGGLSERTFGWRGEAVGFAKNHYDRVTVAELLAGADPGGILVFGDSFSIEHPGGVSWINTLHERTGLTVRLVRIQGFGAPLHYLESEAFTLDPPQAVIVQSVERALLSRAAGVHDPGEGCAAPGSPAFLDPAEAAPLDLPRAPFSRRTTFAGLDELFSWGALAARIRLTGGQEPVLEVQLARDDLFSHRASDRLPILGADVANHLPAKVAERGGAATAAERMRCGLRRMARAAGNVPFRLLVAPDKRTVYASWIADPLPEKALDLFAQARKALGLLFLDLRAPLRDAVERGGRDVYWPDDSHWGAIGHRLVGERAATALAGKSDE